MILSSMFSETSDSLISQLGAFGVARINRVYVPGGGAAVSTRAFQLFVEELLPDYGAKLSRQVSSLNSPMMACISIATSSLARIFGRWSIVFPPTPPLSLASLMIDPRNRSRLWEILASEFPQSILCTESTPLNPKPLNTSTLK